MGRPCDCDENGICQFCDETMRNCGYVPKVELEKKPVQVAVAVADSGALLRGTIVALCSDGTVWEKYGEDEWDRLPDIPQD